MKETRNEIKVYFKQTETCLCPPGRPHHHQNILTFRIQPDEGIDLLFWSKKPDLTFELEPRHFSFSYQESGRERLIPDAYEQVLFDCIRGDQTRFISTEEVSASWQYITPILKNWAKTKLYSYKKGSFGPRIIK